MIVSFGDTATEALFHGRGSSKARRLPPPIVAVALRKLDMIHAARDLRDLRSPPGNRLETLKGDLLGHHSIRINDRLRIVFRWIENDAYHVRIVDYH